MKQLLGEAVAPWAGEGGEAEHREGSQGGEGDG